MRARAVKYWKGACAFFWALVISLAADAQIGGVIVGPSSPNWASPGPIGGTTPNTGKFTTLTATGLFTEASEDALTAHAGGGKALALALSAAVNLHRVSTVTTSGDSILLPPALAGQAHYVRNDGAGEMAVFGQGTDTINGIATATAQFQGPGTGVWYSSVTNGAWTATPLSIQAPTIMLTAGTAAARTIEYRSDGVAMNGTAILRWAPNASYANASDLSNVADTILGRDAAGVLSQKNGANAQASRLYFSTTGPVYWMTTARTAGALYTATGGAAQVSYAQTTVPTVTTNGGTSPACVGTDTAMTCTEGTSPPAAATFTVTFNGTWPAAPSCVAMRGTTGASPLVQGVVTSTTTVVVNLSANLVASEKFHIHCYGVS